MTDTPTYSYRAPDHTLILTPSGEDPQYTYGRTTSGEDFVGFQFTDEQAGPVMLALAPEAVAAISAGLAKVVASIPTMRAAYDRANGLDGTDE